MSIGKKLVSVEVANLYAEMARYKINASQLAIASGVTRVTLTNWRYGHAMPALDKWLTVKDALAKLVGERQLEKAEQV